ncbi:hypothetical protein [Roseomonas genomospecies 6]|uniref:Uncharacterized protein n=1 Tax=Roseomonas genomospecies 6 TaxID=214106 RepID=A0A9W7NHX5_9PROT|nr:hypothetical protein [Roseomonas genomospecies 6]KAA0679168.1 hypothetical protein DS843_16765 [Roseomonas genomospecies 6]
MIQFGLCAMCGVADTRSALDARSGLCGPCWVEMDAARQSGAMHMVWTSAEDGAAWTASPLGLEWEPAVTFHAVTDAADAMLEALAEGRNRIAPFVALEVGPRRRDGRLGVCRDRRHVAVSLAFDPVAVLHHELAHALWTRLRADEREACVEWGDALRASQPPPGVAAHRWAAPEEAEADGFARWALHRPQHGTHEPPAEVAAVWRRMVAGTVGRR